VRTRAPTAALRSEPPQKVRAMFNAWVNEWMPSASSYL